MDAVVSCNHLIACYSVQISSENGKEMANWREADELQSSTQQPRSSKTSQR
jgi:tellurite resistance protein